MDNRERILFGAKGFDFTWWIFSVSFSIMPLRDIRKPRWLAKLMCKFGEHDYFIDSGFAENPSWTCLKCGIKKV